jgi:hypothetical protein
VTVERLGRQRTVGAALCTVLVAACGPHGTIDDPVAGVPLSRQKAISRAGFGFRWPLSVGIGTLACDEKGALLFRTQGITYRLNKAASSAPDIEPLRILAPSAPPSNPLRRMKQADRMEAFKSMMVCGSSERDDRCAQTTLARLGLSPEEWTQVEAEGRERQWPPLTRDLMPLDQLVTAGQALCAR